MKQQQLETKTTYSAIEIEDAIALLPLMDYLATTVAQDNYNKKLFAEKDKNKYKHFCDVQQLCYLSIEQMESAFEILKQLRFVTSRKINLNPELELNEQNERE